MPGKRFRTQVIISDAGMAKPVLRPTVARQRPAAFPAVRYLPSANSSKSGVYFSYERSGETLQSGFS